MLELLDGPATPVADALVRLEQAVSPLVGLVRVAPAIMAAADEPRLHAFACQVASAAKTTGAATVEYAGSAHAHVGRARAASIGEAVGRWVRDSRSPRRPAACTRDGSRPNGSSVPSSGR